MPRPTPPSRRHFLERAAALSATLAAGRIEAAAPDGMPIIDTHQHLWDLTKFRLAWVDAASPLNHSYLPADYRKATAGLNVVQAVYMEVDVVPAQQEDEVKSVVALCRGGTTPTTAAVVSGRPASDKFSGYVARIAREPEVKGVRQVLHSGDTPAGYCLDPKFVAGVRRLGEAGLMFDLCMRSAELPDAAKLVDACPGTRFILDHCGNAAVFAGAKERAAWKADTAELARRERVVCKVSGIVASTRGRKWTPDDLAPVVNHVLDVFGPDRVMFGGDWPVCTLGATYHEWVEALKVVVRDRPEAEQRKLFHDNAARVYALKRA